MPPRLQLLSRASNIAHQRPYQPIAPFLYPSLQSHRAASILSSLSDTPGSYGHRIRRGRGPSSGKGKTSGRGHKGQKQHGKVPVGFNGGQTPDYVVAGSRGFKNHFSVDMAPINLNRIQYWINAGRLDPTKPITFKTLLASRCIHQVKDGVKLLARGKEEFTSPINITVSRASAEAIATVEKMGGTVTTRYYTPFAIRKILKNEMDPVHSLQSRINGVSLSSSSEGESAEDVVQKETDDVVRAVEMDSRKRYRYRLPDPTRRKHLEYYRDAAKRGYLSYMVKEGEGPSLYFKSPPEFEKAKRELAKKKMAAAGKGQRMTVERLW